MQEQQKNMRIGLFYALISLFWMSLYAYQPLLSTYSSDVMGASAVMVGNILGSYGLTQLILRIPLGVLSDKLGKRKLFVILGCAVSLLSSLGLYFSKTPVWLMIFRALAGVAASTWVTITVLFSSYFDPEKAPQAMARATVFNNIGQMIAMYLGGRIGQMLGDRSAFLLSALFGVAALMASLFVVENNPPRKPMRVSALLSVGADKTLLSVSALAIAYQIVNQGAAMGFTPQYAAQLGATSSDKGVLTSMAILGSAVMSFCSSKWLVGKFGQRRCILTGFLLNGAATIAIALFAKNVYTMFALQFLAGCGNGLSFPLLMGMAIKNISGDKRGVAMGFFQSIYALGMYIGPLMTGALIEMATLRISLGCIGAVSLIAFAAALLILPRQKAQGQTNSQTKAQG